MKIFGSYFQIGIVTNLLLHYFL